MLFSILLFKVCMGAVLSCLGGKKALNTWSRKMVYNSSSEEALKIMISTLFHPALSRQLHFSHSSVPVMFSVYCCSSQLVQNKYYLTRPSMCSWHSWTARAFKTMYFQQEIALIVHGYKFIHLWTEKAGLQNEELYCDSQKIVTAF